jgi:hypothetical protein
MELRLTDDDGTTQHALVEFDPDEVMAEATRITRRDTGGTPSSTLDAVAVLVAAGCEGSWDPSTVLNLNWGA